MLRIQKPIPGITIWHRGLKLWISGGFSSRLMHYVCKNREKPENIKIWKKSLLSIIKRLDDELRFYVPFNRISVISGQWKGKHERPCAMKRRLASERISPSAGFEPESPWSDFESAKSSAMRSLLVRSRKQENVMLTTMPIIWIGI